MWRVQTHDYEDEISPIPGPIKRSKDIQDVGRNIKVCYSF